MGQQQSKDELLYQQVNYRNVEGIRELRRQGAGLEWIDKDGKTALIVACMNTELLNVAKTLLDLGANANAYRPGRYAGTPLHHAAKRGLVNTVKLLLSHGANPLIINDDCQTPLDIARSKGFGNVVRAIEGHTCLFSGWLREFYGPGILEALAPQLFARKVWAIILPCGSRNPVKPYKLELAIYHTLQDAQPRTVIALWKAHLEELNFDHGDAVVMIHDSSSKVRIKLGCLTDMPVQQLEWFCNACKGICQAPPAFLCGSHSQVAAATAPPLVEDLPYEIGSPIQSDNSECSSRIGVYETGSSIQSDNSEASSRIGQCPTFRDGAQSNSLDTSSVMQIHETFGSASPSAPLIRDDVMGDDGPPISYPAVDTTPVEFSDASVECSTAKEGEKNESGATCVICLDSPVEGACVPCGHMAGCMSCLNEIKSKKWGCPVCRSKIEQVVRLYTV